MNAKRLIAQFERLTGAPDAVPRLRRFLIDLAVSGKLVYQDSDDEAVSVALARSDLVRREISKRDRRASPMPLDLLAGEDRWDVPSAWEWRALADLVLFIDYRGKTPKKTDHGIRLITAKNVREGFINLVPEEFLSEPEYERWMTRGFPRPGDVLFTTEAPLGKAAVVELTERFALAQRVINFRPYGSMNPQFLLLHLLSDQFQSVLRKTSTGLTAKGIKAAKLKRLPIAVPPLAEQKRIVARVEELMGLCAEFEEAQWNREGRRDRLATTSQRRLIEDTAYPEAFRTSADFYMQRLPRLTTRPEHIFELRRTILDLAIRGALGTQDPTDEPALSLLKQIHAVRRTGAGVSSVASGEQDVPFGIPKGWTWSQLNEIGLINPRIEADDDTVASFIPMPLIPAAYRALVGHEPKLWGEIKKGYTHFAEGDVAVAKITPCFENGKSTIFRNLTGRFGAGTTELHVVRPIVVSPEFVLLFLKSPHFISLGIPKMTGTAGQKRLPKDYFALSPFPLPPLEEQYRIVARVNDLFNVCDGLENQLHEGLSKKARLLEAVLNEALNPAA